MNSNSSLANIYSSPRGVSVEVPLNQRIEEPNDEEELPKFKVSATKVMIISQSLSSACSIAANVVFFISTLGTI